MFKKYHRKYPDVGWQYKAISIKTIDDGKTKEIIYYELNDKGRQTKGIEIYQGSNYIVGSKNRSYSRSYKLQKVPDKYKMIVKQLIKKHKSTIWSKKGYVNLN